MYIFYRGTKNRHSMSAEKTKVRVFMVMKHHKSLTGSILSMLTCLSRPHPSLGENQILLFSIIASNGAAVINGQNSGELKRQEEENQTINRNQSYIRKQCRFCIFASLHHHNVTETQTFRFDIPGLTKTLHIYIFYRLKSNWIIH